MIKWSLSQECKLGLIYKEEINVIYHINKLKEEKLYAYFDRHRKSI